MATGGSTETEIKLKIEDPGAIQKHLESHDFRVGAPARFRDEYPLRLPRRPSAL